AGSGSSHHGAESVVIPRRHSGPAAGVLLPGYDHAGLMSGRARPTYAESVRPMPGSTPAASAAEVAVRAAARRWWQGLIQVLIGADRAPAWSWRSPQERWVAYTALGAATGALCVMNLVGSFAALGQLLLALPVVAPLPLAARYPLLAWRIGWLSLL